MQTGIGQRNTLVHWFGILQPIQRCGVRPTGKENLSIHKGDLLQTSNEDLITCTGYNARMNATIRVTKIGNSAGVILPKEVLAHLGVAVVEAFSVVTTSSEIELRSAEPDFEAQMAAARAVMARRKRALRELAK